MNTIRFKAENFDATAHEVGKSEGFERFYVITSGGQEPKSIRADWDRVETLTKAGWAWMFNTQPDEDAVAKAISLLYSVPGVEVCKE